MILGLSTPIMLATPRAALDLPLRMLIREDGEGRVRVGFHPIVAVLREVGVVAEDAARLVPAQALLIESLKCNGGSQRTGSCPSRNAVLRRE